MMIREVFPGASDTGFIELQMYAGGQQFVDTHNLVTYNSAGMPIEDYEFDGNPTAGGANAGQDQRTILIGENSAAGTPDFTDNDLNMTAAGGGACFISDQFGAIDCVSWGNFIGSLPSSAGNPESPTGVTAGQSLTRTILQGCNLRLDAPDDINDSATDFAETTPSPRNNGVTPTETNCPAAPQTTIGTKPPAFSNSTSATFTFTSTPAAGATFECRLGSDSFEDCTAVAATGKTYNGLTEGQTYTFQVRATVSGQTDPTPASYTWRVVSSDPPPQTEITKPPKKTGTDRTPKIKFKATPPTGATFECTIDGDETTPCTSPYTMPRLSFGRHTIEVVATGPGGP